uniref:F-box domain-containing protein n=1 Tax=Aegilops tauschii TaxID=37682 RepID=M8CA56_AEGTA
MAKALAADAVGVLPDDLLREIFARVAPGVLDLIRCAGTCTRWFRLISCPAFLRRVGISPENARHRPSFLLGAFDRPDAIPLKIPKLRKKTKSDDPPRFFRLRAQQTGGERLTFTKFIPNKNGIFNYASPLTVHRGLLLRSTRLLPTASEDLEPIGYHMTGYALVTASDHHAAGDLDHHPQLVFQVVFTTQCYYDKLEYVVSYCSVRDRWSPPIKCSQTFGLIRSGPCAGVVNGDIVYWLYRDKTNFYTLNITADATHVSLAKIPIQVKRGLPPPFPCILEKGKLSFVHIRDKRILELWTKQEQDNDHSCEDMEGWVWSELTPQQVEGIEILSFAESTCVVLVGQKERGRIFTLDLISNKMQQVIKEDENRPCSIVMERGETTIMYYTR